MRRNIPTAHIMFIFSGILLPDIDMDLLNQLKGEKTQRAAFRLYVFQDLAFSYQKVIIFTFSK